VRRVRHLFATAGLILLLAIPPWTLIRLAGWPLPARPPTLDQLHEWVAQPLTAPTLTAALALTAWLVWLLFAAAVIRDISARTRRAGRWLRRIPIPAPAQATASGLIGATVLGSPATATAATPTPPPAAAPASTSHTPADTPQRQPVAHAGVRLPDGGWLPGALAHTIVTAATLIWLRHRHAYQPGPPNPHRRDPDLTPLPPTVQAVQAATTEQPATGVETRHTVLGHHDLPAGGVGFTGPGAAHAARGVLVGALLTAAGHRTAVITTRATLHHLLPPDTPQARIPGLTVTDDLADALTTATALPHPAGAPPTVLLLDHPGADTERIGRIVAAQPVGALALVVTGAWTTTWQISADGTISGPAAPTPPARLCVLTDTATTDLLTLTNPTFIDRWGAAGQSPPTITPAAGAFVSDPPPAVYLRILGEPTATLHGRPVALNRAAAWQILTYLAIWPHGATANDLTRAIWPHHRPATVTGRLYTTISDLRRTLPATIDRVDDRYRLNPTHIDVDLWHLTTTINAAATSSNPNQRRHHLHQIVNLSTGELAAGRDWPWLAGPREIVHRHLLDAQATLDRPASAQA
jgi:hypothetical protein